jgi:tetratricopeptide (TPR) repeat protein
MLVWVVGDYEEAAAILAEILSIYEPGDPYWEMRCRPAAALLAVDAGRPDEAASHVECCRKILAAGEEWLGLAGSVALAEAVVAAGGGRLREANDHFEKALEVSTRHTLPWLQADTLRYWGRALAAGGDRTQALEKFGAAIQIYRRVGAGQPWIDRIEADQLQTQDAPIKPVPEQSLATTSETVAGDAIFRNEGEFWTVAYQETTNRFKDAKGLRYLAYLLAHPGERIHVRDLVRIMEGQAATKGVALRPLAGEGGANLETIGELGDAGAALDARARTEYKRRLGELRAELEEAERFNDAGHAERIRGEIEFLGAELSAAVGIGGRNRKSAAHAERARLMVGKNIRSALDKIRRRDPSLGHHLGACIKTGYFCSYIPEPARKIHWQL